MSGTEIDRAPQYDADNELFAGLTTRFRIYPATMYNREIEDRVEGYAIVWNHDNVVQAWAANIVQAITFAAQGETQLAMADAALEQAARAADTDGLMDDDVLDIPGGTMH